MPAEKPKQTVGCPSPIAISNPSITIGYSSLSILLVEDETSGKVVNLIIAAIIAVFKNSIL